MKTATRPCPLCNERSVETLHTLRLHQPLGSPLPDVYDVVACTRCGMVYADSSATQADYDRYYAQFSKYEDPAVATGGGGNELDARRLDETASIVARHVPASAKILDIGCAGGGLLAALHNLGYRKLHGADAASACIETVHAQGFAGHCLPLTQLEALAEDVPFDAIVLSHVLEHVADLPRLLSSIASLVAPNGVIYLETPDAARYAGFPHVPWYFFDSEHINHFDPAHLAAAGNHAGLIAEASGERTLEVAPGKLYPAAWAWLRKMTTPVSTPAGNGTLVAAVRNYISACQATPRYQVIEHLARDQTPVVVWGAGSFAQRLFGQGALDGCHVVAIVDRDHNKQGKNFGGHSVEPPETALLRHPDATILILAALHADAIIGEARSINAAASIEVIDTVP